MTSESEIAIAVLKVLVDRPGGEATFEILKAEVPRHVNLTSDDRVKSKTRPAEELWEQRLRNITSHQKSPGNIIHDGYAETIHGGLRITAVGRLHATTTA